jgi:hypothetical protein
MVARALLVTGALAALAQPACAASLFDPVPDDQLRSMCADRPGKATPPCIVDAGHVQVEVGLVDAQFQKVDGENTNTDAIGAFEMRVGLGKTTEGFVGWTPWQIRVVGGHSSSSVGNLFFGVKQSLANPDESGVSVAVQATAVAPTASDSGDFSGWAGQFSLPIAVGIGNATLSFTPEIDVLHNASQPGNHVAVSEVVGLGFPVGPISAGVELWAGRDNDPSGAASATTLDFTAAWVPAKAKNWQLDGGVNIGLSGNIASTETYVGVSHRF